ncbi:phytanoyl-CoA dioxygenase family protein [Pseudarcicella hirudinis]|uniref:phytanoyl-CoA dioxygenase family protein n=1 Tax=Pseudarcicella hirudinis TaxID=1079859 RepID=UPI0035E6CB1F
MANQKEQYNKDGYLLIKGFFSKEEIAQIYQEARQIFGIQIERVLGKKVDINDKDTFEKAMFEFFERISCHL